MLKDRNAMATIAVRDLAAAKKFYGGTLGLAQNPAEDPGVATYRSGQSTIVVYQSDFAGTNRATSATWSLADQFDTVMRGLQTAGIRFEHYELPGLERDGDVHSAGDFKAAWFKDPDGNILHINNG